MSIYVIGDLHLSFGTNKPMEVFGGNWEKHYEKIKDDWKSKVKENDLVLLLGDFSWAMYLKDTLDDFKYLNRLPGKKILLKGNHDYWWTTLNKMKQYLSENNFQNIDFLYNNSYVFENKIIVGTRGWNNGDSAEDKRIIRRENIRLENSIKDGIKKYGEDKEIIACMHYPPFNNYEKLEMNFISTMKKYNVKKCFYAHLHGEETHKQAVQEIIQGIDFRLVSSDYLEFKLIKI